MKKIYGKVRDKHGNPLSGADVMLENKDFEEIAVARADENGNYCIEAEAGHYPYMLAVRDYADKYLEHWVGNITLNEDMEINYLVDELEVYGLTCFKIRGGAPALCIYFRPMSLEKYKAGLADISPDIDADSITIRVNDEPVLLGSCNEVKEFCQMSETNEAVCLKGYFIMTTLPQSGLKKIGNFLEVKIKDKLTQAIGCAGLFFDEE